MTALTKCLTCGASFKAYRRSGKYCNPVCSSKAHLLKLKTQRANNTAPREKTCPTCEQTFTVYSNHAVYCSMSCCEKARWQKTRANYPGRGPLVEHASDLAAGTAAEHIVCADILLQGYKAFLADQNCPFDVAVVHGSKLVRVQVKSTRNIKALPHRPGAIPLYMFSPRRAGKAGKRTYSQTDFDIIACVALDIKAIAYFPHGKISKATIHLRQPDHHSTHGNAKHKTIVEYPFESALRDVGLLQ